MNKFNGITLTYLNKSDVYNENGRIKPVFIELFGSVEVLPPKVGGQFLMMRIQDIDRWLIGYKSTPTKNLVAVKVDVNNITALRLGIKSTLGLNPTYKTKDQILFGTPVTIENIVSKIAQYFKSVASIVDEVDYESFMPEDAQELVDYAAKAIARPLSQKQLNSLYKDIYSLVNEVS